MRYGLHHREEVKVWRAMTLMLLALVGWSAAGAAAPSATLSWDDCDSQSKDRSFAGPGAYRQVVSAAGFEGVLRGYRIRLHLTASNVYDWPSLVLPDAWRFDRPDGCQAERLGIDTASDLCPGFAPGATSFAVSYDFDGFDLDITLLAAFAPVQPDPSLQYTLFALDWDHARSAPGPHDPAEACGNADQRICFVLRDAQWSDADLQSHPIAFEPFWGLSWQDSEGSCFWDLAVQPSHWTGVKTLYR